MSGGALASPYREPSIEQWCRIPVMKPDSDDLKARQKARASWQIRIFRPGDEEAEANADALFWDSIPLDQRAEATWKLSEELFELMSPGSEHERRLPRSSLRPVRR
jgi:hypothetical protein